MTRRPATSSKFSPVDLLLDHYQTLRNADSGRYSLPDLATFVGLPGAGAVGVFLTGAQARHMPELLGTTAIFTGLIFGVFVLMFDMTMRAQDRTDGNRRGPVLQLASELRANISYAVLLGIVLSGLLGGYVMLSDQDKLPSFVTAILVFGMLQLLLTIFMVLKRVRALYRAYPAAQSDRIP